MHARKKFKWNHITLKKHSNWMSTEWIEIKKEWMKKIKKKHPGTVGFCSFIGLYNIFFILFIFFKSFLSVLFFFLSFFCAFSLFRIYGLLVYSSSLYRSCALYLVSPFGDRDCVVGSIALDQSAVKVSFPQYDR